MKRIKNTVLRVVTIAAILLNMMFSVCSVWIANFHIGYWFVIWAVCQMWILIFILANTDNSDKRRR